MANFGRKTCKDGHLMASSWKHCPVCLAPVCGWLVLMKDHRAEKVYTIHEGVNKTGSGADCEVRILADGIARNHVILKCFGDNHSIIDAGSDKGLVVNDKRVTNIRLIDGDIVTLGSVNFKFKCI